MKPLKKRKLKVIDLFSGCGGLNEGFKEAGFNTSVSNDIWEPASNTFVRNNKNINFVIGDITKKTTTAESPKKRKRPPGGVPYLSD